MNEVISKLYCKPLDHLKQFQKSGEVEDSLHNRYKYYKKHNISSLNIVSMQLEQSDL